MSNTEFINWLRGFAEGVHHYNITPAQWDHLKEQLAKVKSKTDTYDVSKPSEGWERTTTWE